MIIPVPIYSDNLKVFFTEILPEFMNKYGFNILSFELKYLLPIIILLLFFKFFIKKLFRV